MASFWISTMPCGSSDTFSLICIDRIEYDGTPQRTVRQLLAGIPL